MLLVGGAAALYGAYMECTRMLYLWLEKKLKKNTSAMFQKKVQK